MREVEACMHFRLTYHLSLLDGLRMESNLSLVCNHKAWTSNLIFTSLRAYRYASIFVLVR